MTRTGRSSRRSERGSTLLETMLTVAIGAMIGVPILIWSVTGLRVERTTERRSELISAQNVLSSHLSRDVASARSAVEGGPDCGEGDGAGGTVLLTLTRSGALDRVAYVVAPSGESTVQLWRRACGSDGRIVADALLDDVTPPAGGWSDAVTCSDISGMPPGTCAQVELRVGTPDGRLVAAVAARRIGSA